MSYSNSLHLFEAYGVELEYMIVDSETLQVKPIADELIKQEVGAYVSDVEFEHIAWSNELVMHVIELKTNGPAKSLPNLILQFQEQVTYINEKLKPLGAKLLPTGAHPFMNPITETKLWPHDYNAVYEAYDRIFNTKGHGWSNLQSTHLNLPFANEEEFARLHAAIRLLLPIIPAISASSPFLDGGLTGFTDARLEVYRKNQAKIPSIAGRVIPEQVFSEADYQEIIYNKIYRDIAPHDPEGILQEPFLNSRGTIARFDRRAIEIRIIDIQECPLADLTILAVVVAVLKLLVSEKNISLTEQKKWHENELADIFEAIIKTGLDTSITNTVYLNIFGLKEQTTAWELWRHLVDEIITANLLSEEFESGINLILEKGNLSERIISAYNQNPSPENLRIIYQQLAKSLSMGEFYLPE